MKKDNKLRLFEMMGKVDSSFKPKLNEDYDRYGELQQKIKNGDVWLEYYSPSESQEYTDGENWWNRGGDEIRHPDEYDRSDPEWTPFGDEGDLYENIGEEKSLSENSPTLNEKRFEPETFYNTQSEAVDAAVQKAESMGYEVDKDDIWRYFGQGWVGYENDRRGIITLYKNGVEQRKGLVIVLYRMRSGKYELTTYIN